MQQNEANQNKQANDKEKRSGREDERPRLSFVRLTYAPRATMSPDVSTGGGIRKTDTFINKKKKKKVPSVSQEAAAAGNEVESEFQRTAA